jgi:beta-N-acetylhexosaminidase
MRDLTITEKIGQMLMFGWQGATPEENLTVSEHAGILVDEFRVGGIALLGRNVSTPERVTATMNELQSRSPVPLLISVDQEGGPVARLKCPFAIFPSNMALAATGSPDYCRRAAQAVAQELLAVGINFNFAPCLDVNINPENPIIGVRSYGESPDTVAKFGVAAIEGYQSQGLFACAKHFPGHGDTDVDTHLSLPAITYEWDRLNAVELLPFRAAIEAGVASIMTTHIAFTVLDQDLPATLSKAVITGLLRNDLGYDGLIITDCLEMKAISDNFTPEDAAVLAVQAGVDILLDGHTLEYQRRLRQALIDAVESGVISEKRIDESVARILAAKKQCGLYARRPADPAAIYSIVGADDIQQLKREIAERSVTLIRNADGFLPLRPQARDQIAVIGMHPVTAVFAEVIRERHSNIQEFRISASPTPEEIAKAEELAKGSHAVVIAACPEEPWVSGLVDEQAQAKFINRLLDSGVPAVIIAAREPYLLRQFPRSRACMATYGYPEDSVRAAVDVLFGIVQPTGRLPVTVPNCAPMGAGLRGFAG